MLGTHGRQYMERTSLSCFMGDAGRLIAYASEKSGDQKVECCRLGGLLLASNGIRLCAYWTNLDTGSYAAWLIRKSLR